LPLIDLKDDHIDQLQTAILPLQSIIFISPAPSSVDKASLKGYDFRIINYFRLKGDHYGKKTVGYRGW
jgi:hypothetical protein